MKWIPKYQKAGKLNFKTTGLPWQQSKQDQEISRNAQSIGILNSTNLKRRLQPAAKNLRTKYNNLSTKERIALAKRSIPHSEIVIVKDQQGNTKTSTNPQAGAMSGADPIGEFIVGTTVGNLGLGLSKIALSKMGQNAVSHWARNSLLNETAGSLTKNIATPLIESEAVPLEDGFVYRTFTPSHGGFIKNNLVYNRSYGVRGLIKSLRPLLGKVLSVNRAPESYFNFNKNLSQIWKKRRVISKVNKELKKGIKENSILESYNKVPANKDIGTAYDYLDFLDNIYPNSKLNAIFYHGGPKGITKFKTAKELGSTNKGINSATKDYGIYLADDKSLAQYYAGTHKKANRHLYNVRVNVQNPMRYETNNWYMDKFNTTGDLRFRPGEITQKWYDKLNLKNYDGIYHTKSKNAFDNGELVMFDGNNIHIMGTPEESQMFRKWKQNPQYSSKPLQEEIPLTPEQYERSFLNYAKAATPGLIFAGLAATPLAIIQYNKYQKSKVANDRVRNH